MIRKTLVMDDLIDVDINQRLNPLVYAIDRNQLGWRHDRCVCETEGASERRKDKKRPVESEMGRKSDRGIAEIRRRVGKRARSRALEIRIANGWYGSRLSREVQARRSLEDMENPLTYKEIDRWATELGVPRYKGGILRGAEFEETRSAHVVVNLSRTNPCPIRGPTVIQAIPHRRKKEMDSLTKYQGDDHRGPPILVERRMGCIAPTSNLWGGNSTRVEIRKFRYGWRRISWRET